ncbi:MAG: translation initiation factor IF-2, partial [Simkaniaceae bacterium]|nr:translation initiation factor IF-2 [Simkaniaceae bacterium]
PVIKPAEPVIKPAEPVIKPDIAPTPPPVTVKPPTQEKKPETTPSVNKKPRAIATPINKEIRKSPSRKPIIKETKESRPTDAKTPTQEKKGTSTRATSSQPLNKPSESASPINKKAIPKPAKRYETPSSFDSRDRQGLRSDDERSWRRRKPSRYKTAKKSSIEIVRPKNLHIRLPISLKDLAVAMKLKASEIIAKLFMQGVTITINDTIEEETLVQLIGHDFACEITIDTSEEERLRITNQTIQEEIALNAPDQLKQRPPVIAFMGHVDHGKTSLIDTIRKSQIAHGEAGAITQHIGAFKYHKENGDITILDTPGHEAFTLMRERGINITDLVILVIAGDEGIKPQTEEAINKAKSAGVPIIVAINKCDKPDFNAENVYRQLSDHELLPEAWGGAIITVNCSAVTREGIDELLEMIILQSEVLELKACSNTRARGTIIESEKHKGHGSVATVLVQNGTLKLGDAIVLEEIYGRVKSMYDENGKSLTEAPPSTPVKITGLSGIPAAGSEFIVVDSEKEARKLCLERTSGEVRARLSRSKSEGIEILMQKHTERSEKKILNLIIRADVQGSIEALINSLQNIKTDKVELNFIAHGVGEISESDVELSVASSAPIIGFHTNIESHAEPLVRHFSVKIIQHDIIYHIINDVKQLMVEKLDKVREVHESGTATVQTTFKVSSLGTIAGCIVNQGSIKKNQIAKLFRKDELLWEGEISSLKRVKEDVKEVKQGLECGILLKKFNDFEEGDQIKSYTVTYTIQEL